MIRYDDFVLMLKEEYGENLFKNNQYKIYEYCREIDEVYEIFNDDFSDIDFYNKIPKLKAFFNTDHNIYIYTHCSIINYKTYEHGLWVIKGNELTEFVRTYKGAFFNNFPIIFNFSNHSCYMHRSENPDGNDICIFRDYTKLKKKYLYQKFVNFLNNYRIRGIFMKNKYIENDYRILTYVNENYYEGEIKGDKKNDYGVLNYKDGNRYEREFKESLNHYEGEFKEGKKNGYGVLNYEDGNRYEGEFKENLFHGQGILTYANGSRYEGKFKEGFFHGYGVLTYKDVIGTRYEGEFKEGKKNGYGILNYENANGQYEGEFKDNLFHGHGVLTYGNETRYEGEFKEGLFHGHGVLTYEDGDQYEGEFKDKFFYGYGIYTFANGDCYKGEFKDNLFHGHGVYIYANGNRYEGEFKDNRKNGYGILTYANGNRYEGEFKDNLFHGHGVYIVWNSSFWLFRHRFRCDRNRIDSPFVRSIKSPHDKHRIVFICSKAILQFS